MKKPIEKIIIVGGGSAGWMSAAMLSKQFPNFEIAVIESPDVPIVGVGESTLGTINSYLAFLGLDDKDWMEYCNATYKLSIKFTDFYAKGEEFYYPFGIKDLQNTQAGAMDWYIKKAMTPELSHNDFYECMYSSMPFIYQSKIFDNKDGQLPGFSWRNDVAYHMDAALFGEFLREKVCEPNGVVHIREHVNDIILTDDGEIDFLVLRNGDELKADLYLDCTGFQALLIEKALGVPFIPFNNVLPNNRAWVTHIPYVDKEKEMENVTNCTAINNGWVWNIPLYNRIGSGYVFSDKFISEEDALEEYKNYLDSEQMKVYKNDRSKDLEFKLIKIKNGAHERCWHKNVVAVGLSYGFIEPLESTGLLSVQEVLLKLCETLHNKQINKIHIDNFNFVMYYIMDGFKNFVGFHYAYSSRRDTPYWRHVTEEIEMDPLMNDKKFFQVPSAVAELGVKLIQTHNLPGDTSSGGLPDILVGMHTMPANPTQLTMVDYIITARTGTQPTLFNQQTQEYWDQKKEYINTLAEDAPSHYQYLKENIYNGKD